MDAQATEGFLRFFLDLPDLTACLVKRLESLCLEATLRPLDHAA
jgi:hypothetical protein